jgi:hypothetical protein
VDVAAAHLEDALRAAATIGASVQVARAQLAYARVLLARGAPGDAARAHHLLVELLASLEQPEGHAAAAPVAPAAPPRHGYAFRREGDYWTLASPGRLARVRGLRGFEYIAELLRRPHRAVYVVELMSPSGRRRRGSRRARSASTACRSSRRRAARRASTAAPASTTAPDGASCWPIRRTPSATTTPVARRPAARDRHAGARARRAARAGARHVVGAGAGARQRAQLRQRRAAVDPHGTTSRSGGIS